MGSDSKELLGIEPLELRFPFEFMKQISCSMELTNRTDDYLAFKVIGITTSLFPTKCSQSSSQHTALQ
uniref:MSP domain-containing protein n=1 Tax=Aegilops tauschii subsp. strangulata TaxID=200361 RepID=A0A453CF26_AEGTS